MQVITNALVSSLKELIEPSLRPSNHLIATCPKVDGNTLHIKVSFFEWTTILWLKWLTCSTGSDLPLYRVNVGWVNHWGSFPLSTLWVKDDFEIWFRALPIASLPRPLQDRLPLSVYNGDPHHTKKTHWEESWTWGGSYYYYHHQKRCQNLKEFPYIARGVTSFANDQSLVACS